MRRHLSLAALALILAGPGSLAAQVPTPGVPPTAAPAPPPQLLPSDLFLEELLERHFTAIGGREIWEKTTTLKFEGSMRVGPGIEAPIRMVAKRPDKVRIEYTVGDRTVIQGFDGVDAWQTNPVTGAVESLSAEYADDLAEQADFDGPLLGWETEGHEVQLLGMERTPVRESYKIAVRFENGRERTIWIDKPDFRIRQVDSVATIQGEEVTTETTFYNYRDVGGLILPHTLEIRRADAPIGDRITFTVVKVGDRVPDDRFSPPTAQPAAEESAVVEETGTVEEPAAVDEAEPETP